MKTPDALPTDLASPEASTPAPASDPPPLTPEERRARRIARLVTLAGAILAAAAAVALFLRRGGPSLPPYAVVFAEGEARVKGASGPGVAPVRLAPGADVDLVLRPASPPRTAARVLVCAAAAGELTPVEARVDESSTGALHVRVHADAILAVPGTEQLWIVVAPADADLATACEAPPSRSQMVLVRLTKAP